MSRPTLATDGEGLARKRAQKRAWMARWVAANRDVKRQRDRARHRIRRGDLFGTHARSPLEERMWRFIVPEPMSGCWLWTGTRSGGYGRIGAGGRTGVTLWAHRVVYEALRGPIPAGLTIDHLCRLRICVNPWHLEPVTRQENGARAMAPRRS